MPDDHALVHVSVEADHDGKLSVTVTVTCDVCTPATQTCTIAGHHLYPVVNMLLEILDQYPELVSHAGQLRRVSVAHRSRPFDPSCN